MERNHFAFVLQHSGQAKLAQAILIYRGTGGAPAPSYATVHEIDTSGAVPVILPGRAATRAGLVRLSQALSHSARHSGLIPASALYADGHTLLWWVPPAQRHLTFHCTQWPVADRAAVLPHPGLVFLCNKKSWQVWAVKGYRRPHANTVLYRAPYFNVYDSGQICHGNVVLPQANGFEHIGQWNDAFFDSRFTHVNAVAPLVRHPGGAYAFWQMLLDDAPARFPCGALVRLPLRLHDLTTRKEHDHA